MNKELELRKRKSRKKSRIRKSRKKKPRNPRSPAIIFILDEIKNQRTKT